MKKIHIFLIKIINSLYTKLFISSDFVKQPTITNLGVSDLFVWRNDKNWKTYFELLDVFGLIACDLEASSRRFVIATFFNKTGELILEKKIALNNYARNTISIKNIVNEFTFIGHFGTFAIFHSVDKTLENDVVLTDRGYCGYEFKNSHFRDYVHGNFDAIENCPNGTKLLMGSNKISRFYNLQHILTGPSTYDIALVNPTEVNQIVKIIAKGNYNKVSYSKKLNPRGGEIFTFNLADGEFLRLRIKSKMYMARPSIFRYTESFMDVVHG